jgi:hypothetical protein
MIEGNITRFAIEGEVAERIDSWVLGHIRFWICGNSVGEWSDSVDLLGCLRWLNDFASTPRSRYESGLFELPAREVFRRVYDPVMPHSGAGRPGVTDAFSRFHISHLGMSAFERFDLLLLTDEHGAERCLWRETGSEEIHECYLWRLEMERVAGQFCARFERELGG